MLNLEKKEVVMIDPKKLIFNQGMQKIYDIPLNYEDLKTNIKGFGIMQPLLVTSKLEVISGNLRLRVALDLKFKEVPIIFFDLNVENDLMPESISSNVYREKSLMDKYNEILFIDSLCSSKQGSRTDKNPQLKEESILKKKLISKIPTYTVNQIRKATKLLCELNKEDVSAELVKNIKKIDKDEQTLNAFVSSLEKEVEQMELKLNVPEFYEIHREGFAVYNRDSSSLSELEDNSISTIVCSPPYRKMRKYGDDPNELGKENTKEEYIERLLTHYNSCHRVLKDDGSLFVNISEGVQGDSYEGSVQLFVVEMLRTSLWKLNDEVIWQKHNPVYTKGNRFVRAHEYVFHFVKSNNQGFKYNSGLFPFIKDEKGMCVYGMDKDSPKILSSLNLRDNIFYTNVANTGQLRKLCKTKELLPMDHTATFPLSVPALFILLTTNEGDTVLDIFNGSGVSGEACIKLGRNYIGYEKYASYVKATEVRINNMAA